MKKLASIAVLAIAVLAPFTAAAQFARVTSGPDTTPTCLNAGPNTLQLDSSSNVVQSCGSAQKPQTHQTSLAAVGAQTAVTSVTTAQSMYSLALPARIQNTVGRTLRICGYGVYTSPGTTTPTITIQLTEGGITPVAVTSAAVSSTASTNMPFQFCFDLTTAATGSSGTLEAHGQVSINISANTPAAAAATYNDTNTAVSSTLDLTAANTLAVQVAASSTITSVTLRQLTIELVS